MYAPIKSTACALHADYTAHKPTELRARTPKTKPVTKIAINKFHFIAFNCIQRARFRFCLALCATFLRWHLSMPSALTPEPRLQTKPKSSSHDGLVFAFAVKWVWTRMACTLLRFDKCVYEFKCKRTRIASPAAVVFVAVFGAVSVSSRMCVAGGSARFHNNPNKDHLFYFCFIAARVWPAAAFPMSKKLFLSALGASPNAYSISENCQVAHSAIAAWSRSREQRHHQHQQRCHRREHTQHTQKNRLRNARIIINFASYRVSHCLRNGTYLFLCHGSSCHMRLSFRNSAGVDLSYFFSLSLDSSIWISACPCSVRMPETRYSQNGNNIRFVLHSTFIVFI